MSLQSRVSLSKFHFLPFRFSGKMPYPLTGAFSAACKFVDLFPVPLNDQANVMIDAADLYVYDQNDVDDFMTISLPAYPSVVGLENVIFLHTIEHLLSKLSVCPVVLNKSYSPFFEKYKNQIQIKALGIGMKDKTWHGVPDGRVRGTELSYSALLSGDEGDDDDSAVTTDDSQGTSTCVEAKRAITWGNHTRLALISIVSAFTESTRHPNANPGVPSILINENKAKICIYNPDQDILLISNTIVFKCNEEVIKDAAFLLWLTINHR